MSETVIDPSLHLLLGSTFECHHLYMCASLPTQPAEDETVATAAHIMANMAVSPYA